MNITEQLGAFLAIAVLLEQNPDFYTPQEITKKLVDIKNNKYPF